MLVKHAFLAPSTRKTAQRKKCDVFFLKKEYGFFCPRQASEAPGPAGPRRFEAWSAQSSASGRQRRQGWVGGRIAVCGASGRHGGRGGWWGNATIRSACGRGICRQRRQLWWWVGWARNRSSACGRRISGRTEVRQCQIATLAKSKLYRSGPGPRRKSARRPKLVAEGPPRRACRAAGAAVRPWLLARCWVVPLALLFAVPKPSPAIRWSILVAPFDIHFRPRSSLHQEEKFRRNPHRPMSRSDLGVAQQRHDR